ncbi:hypothetical protein WMY93_015096 [Mugilogobius chulae]|uniref:C-type lectin domain-containing protein n=1 Tax=Mugilogobius chulae TaxID=88201 RepID=A0AAW0NWU6_9GOBI
MANSPDLNVIENLWAIVKRKIRDRKPTKLDQLKQNIATAWEAVSAETCDKLVKSMPRRLQAVIQAKGAAKKYCESQICLSVSQDHVYHFINESKSWAEAQTFCRKYYTDLATVNHMRDLERLRAAADGQTDVWIGLHQTSTDRTDRKWYWSQPEVKYNESEAVWNSGEPSDTGDRGYAPENCVLYSYTHETWNDAECYNAQGCFICYNESSNIVVLIKESKIWLEAQQFCRTHHTDLMSGPDQQRIFKTYSLNKQEWCWIGLSRDNWGWSDGSNSAFRSWKTAVCPENYKCAALLDQDRWESQDCALKKPFICHGDGFYKPAKNKTQKNVVKIKMSSDVDLTSLDPVILQQLQEYFRANNMPGVKLSWKKGKDNKVFHKQKNPDKKQKKTCDNV